MYQSETNATLSVENASVTFRSKVEEVHALNRVSFDATSGEMVALMGASGSGKSTLLNVLAGLQVTNSGKVIVADRHLEQSSEDDRAELRLHTVGVVFQDHNLIPEFTVEENILVPLRARGFGRAEAAREVARCLEAVDLPGVGRRMPAELSGGQQQRVGIARALAGGRQVLLADEPSGSLDSVNTQALFQLLRNLAENGACVIVATHDLSIESFADRVVTIKDGTIVENRLTSSISSAH